MEHILVLEAYGGDSGSERELYKKGLEANVTQGESLKLKVIGQCVLGPDSFVAWVKQTFLEKEKAREQAYLWHDYIAQLPKARYWA